MPSNTGRIMLRSERIDTENNAPSKVAIEGCDLPGSSRTPTPTGWGVTARQGWVAKQKNKQVACVSDGNAATAVR